MLRVKPVIILHVNKCYQFTVIIFWYCFYFAR